MKLFRYPYWYKSHFPNVNIHPSDFRQIPIRSLDLSDRRHRASHDRVVDLVNRILYARSQYSHLKSPHDQRATEREIASADSEIDRLVYEFYGLNEEEIALVEDHTGSTSRE